jgi:hypothetical protein
LGLETNIWGIHQRRSSSPSHFLSNPHVSWQTQASCVLYFS